MSAALQRLYPQAEKRVVISNATNVVPPSTSVARHDLKTIGFIANIGRDKGVMTFIDVAEAVHRERPQVTAVLAGPFTDTSVRDEVQSRLVGAPWLTYTGPVHDSEKDEFYRAVDVLVFPTRYAEEAEPRVINEALSYGAPVVSTRRGCIPDILDRGAGLAIRESEDFVAAASRRLVEWYDTPSSFAATSAAALQAHHEMYRTDTPRFEAALRDLIEAAAPFRSNRAEEGHVSPREEQPQRRVLSIIHFPVFGGPHNRALRIAASLEARGWTMVVTVPSEDGTATSRLRAGGVQTVSIPLSRARATLNPLRQVQTIARFGPDVQRLRQLIRDMDADVVLINGLANPHGAIAARLEGKPVVWQILDTRTPPPFREGLMLMTRGLADVLMVTGHRVARLHWGSASFGERLVTFFPPVDTDLFRPDTTMRAEARQELGFGGDDFVVGTVGNINPQKRHSHFLRAAAILRESLPNARFAILGATSANHAKYAATLAKEAEQLGLRLGDDLVMMDPAQRVNVLASAFDLFWLTAGNRSEGISTVVEEAMSLGIPVLATDVGSLREAVDNGQTGFVVAPDDVNALASASLLIARDPALHSTMSVKSRQVAQSRFSVKASAEAHLAAFEMAMAVRGR
jgi:glycosyltransferase involved in cell wall biosynthesis